MAAVGDDMNATMRKFGAPDTRVCRYDHWSVLLRPAQATLGALVLAAHGPATAFGQLEPAAFTELHRVTVDLESALEHAFGYEKLNYLMLMMVDPEVHFHVLPRYAGPRTFADVEFIDPGWPGPPDLGQSQTTDPETNRRIQTRLQECWPERS